MSDLVPFEDETPTERLARLQAAVADAKAQADQVAQDAPSGGAANLPATRNLPATEVKRQMAQQRAALLHAQEDVRLAVAAVKDEVDRQKRDMEAQMRAVMAEMEPLMERVKQMEEGIWTVNLYLGRDEQIETVIDGEPAPADTPLVIRQMTLHMDEEVAVFPESGGMDFTQIGIFTDWLKNPVHLNTLLPEPKGVVAVKPRRTDKKYTGNPIADSFMNEANHATYFLIRNGERVFVHSTDFNVGDTLTPAQDEFTRMFRTSKWDHATRQNITIDLEPGTDAWLKAEKAADARQRHFMRVALILQGLIDRTTVFHPLPEGGLSTLHPEAYESGAVVMLNDGDNAIGTGREPYRDWVRRLNRDLRPGMRIVGAFNTRAWREMRSREGYNYDEHERITPRRACDPESLVIHTLDGRRDEGLTFKFVRNEQVWVRNDRGYDESRQPKTRATAVIYPSDTFVLAFDLVTAEQIRDYMNARTERHAYMDMMPLLKAALALKEAEAEAEAPFRDLIARQIATTHAVDLDDRLAGQVTDLVDWWKHTNRVHRPLVASDITGATDEAKALRMIVAEWDRRRRADDAGDTDAEDAAVARLREEYPDLMYVGRARDGKVVAFAPQPSIYPVETTGPRVYVREVRTTITGRGKTTVKDWVLPGNRATRIRTLFETEQWTGWDRVAQARDYLTDEQILEGATAAADQALAVLSKEKKDRLGKVMREALDVRLIAVAHDPKDKEFAVILHPVTHLPSPDEPVTTSSPSAKFLKQTFRWTLPAGADLPTVEARWWASQDETWRTDPFTRNGPLEVPWHDPQARYRRPGLVIFDQDVFDEAMRVRQVLKERAAASADRAALITNIHASLREQWDTRVQAEAYERFIEDYADATLWEGHLKTLRLEQIPIETRDRSYRRGDHFFKETFWSLARLLIDQWVEVDGMTVAEFAAAGREHGAETWEFDERITDLVIHTERTAD